MCVHECMYAYVLLCVHVCTCLHGQVHVCTHVCVWRSEVNLGDCSCLDSTYFAGFCLLAFVFVFK